MKKAFTMVELIVTIVILSIISVIGAGIIKFSYDNQIKVETFNALELKSQAAIDFISAHTNNAIKNSFRLKKDLDATKESDCKKSTENCKFVYNIPKQILGKGQDFKVFEWARIAIKEKRAKLWDGLTKTAKIKDIEGKLSSRLSLGAKNSICFDSNDILDIKPLPDMGIYFLGDNIANSTTFMEVDLFDYIGGKICFKHENKNFTISSAYVLVDYIESLIYEDDTIKLVSRKKPNFDTEKVTDLNTVVLVDNVSDFEVSNLNGVTRIKLCLEAKDLPGNYFSKSTDIKVCKTGVVL